jgi:SAM-dependent methyltransferase
MCPAEHDILRAAEDAHWWYAVLRRLVRKEMQARVPRGSRVLDAGCGTGGMMAQLTEWDMHGIDIAPWAIRHCQERGLSQVTQTSLHELPFESASFDAVLSLDVLYHEQVDEHRALKEMARVLKPGGVLIMNLPAFDCLRGAHDHAVGGVRRYTACKVRERLLIHNLSVDMTHYWNAWLFLPLLVWRRWTRMRPDSVRSDVRRVPAWLNSALTHLGWLDARASRRLHLIGSSVFTVAHRHE